MHRLHLIASPPRPARRAAARWAAALLTLLASARSFADGAAAPATPEEAPRRERSALVVVLDPGHGGAFPHDGAHGTRGLVEKTIALQVTKRLRADLEAAGATVLLTREDDDTDVSLADRARFANEADANLFVSIHCNSMATRHDRSVTRGVESYFLSPNPTDAEAKMLAELENGGPAAVPVPKSTDAVTGLLANLALGQARNDSAVLAETLHRALLHATFAQSRGVRQAPFLVLSGTKMPSALIEIGFISHPVEGRLLSKESYQQKIADALSQGVREFAAHVLMRRLLPPTEEARAALLARRSEAAQERERRLKAQASLGPKAAPSSIASSSPLAPARSPSATPESPGASPPAPAASAASNRAASNPPGDPATARPDAPSAPSAPAPGPAAASLDAPAPTGAPASAAPATVRPAAAAEPAAAAALPEAIAAPSSPLAVPSAAPAIPSPVDPSARPAGSP